MSGSNPSRKPWVKPPRLVDEAEVAMARRSPRRRKGFSPATCHLPVGDVPESFTRHDFASEADVFHPVGRTVASCLNSDCDFARTDSKTPKRTFPYYLGVGSVPSWSSVRPSNLLDWLSGIRTPPDLARRPA